MEEWQKDAIKDNYPFLVQNLQRKELMAYFVEQNIIFHSQQGDIEATYACYTTNQDKNEKLLRYLLTGHPDSYERFINALEKTNQGHLAERLPREDPILQAGDDEVDTDNDITEKQLQNVPSQLPPLTPSTDQKLSDGIRAALTGFEKERTKFNIDKDPHKWSQIHVRTWLFWAIREFQLENLNTELFDLDGAELCCLSRDEFSNRCPPLFGDLLWEHLEMMKKDSLIGESHFNFPVVVSTDVSTHYDGYSDMKPCIVDASPQAKTYSDPCPSNPYPDPASKTDYQRNRSQSFNLCANSNPSFSYPHMSFVGRTHSASFHTVPESPWGTVDRSISTDTTMTELGLEAQGAIVSPPMVPDSFPYPSSEREDGGRIIPPEGLLLVDLKRSNQSQKGWLDPTMSDVEEVESVQVHCGEREDGRRIISPEGLLPEDLKQWNQSKKGRLATTCFSVIGGTINDKQCQNENFTLKESSILPMYKPEEESYFNRGYTNTGSRASACYHEGHYYALDWSDNFHRLLRYNLVDRKWSAVEVTFRHRLSNWFLLSRCHRLYIHAIDNDYKTMVLLSFDSSTLFWHLVDWDKAIRHDFSTAGASEAFFVTGGSMEHCGCSAMVTCYHVNRGAWEGLPDMISERRCHASVWFNNCIYVCGGVDDTDTALSSCERYDITDRRWESIHSMNEGRYNFSLTALSNKIVAAGGATDEHTALSSIEIYCPERDSWRVASYELKEGRFDHTAIVFSETQDGIEPISPNSPVDRNYPHPTIFAL